MISVTGRRKIEGLSSRRGEVKEVEVGYKEHECFIVRQNADCSVDHKAHCPEGVSDSLRTRQKESRPSGG
jgi:hypothetical protein